MLLLFAKQHLNLLKKHRELVVVLQMELRQSNEFIQEYRNTKFVEYIDIVSEIIHKGQEEGLFRPEIMPGIIKRAYFGALDEMTRLWILSPQPHYTLDEAAVQICDVFLNGLVVK
jgi:TetR/AcrR family fatty acid metabolism transcriptional regulator